MLAGQPPPTAFQPRLPASFCRAVEHLHTPNSPGDQAVWVLPQPAPGPLWNQPGSGREMATLQIHLVFKQKRSLQKVSFLTTILSEEEWIELLSDTSTSENFLQRCPGRTYSRESSKGMSPFPRPRKAQAQRSARGSRGQQSQYRENHLKSGECLKDGGGWTSHHPCWPTGRD